MLLKHGMFFYSVKIINSPDSKIIIQGCHKGFENDLINNIVQHYITFEIATSKH